MDQREEVLRALTEQIPRPSGAPVRVAIDGADAAGKSTLRRELATLLSRAGRDVLEASMDDFHQPREVRYRQGRDSAPGYWEDGFNRGAFVVNVLVPLSPGGNRVVTLQHHDLRTDEPVAHPLTMSVADDVILLADGLFMQHPQLAPFWDAVIYLDVPYSERFARMVRRDGVPNDAEDRIHLRHFEAQLIYRREVSPRSGATFVLNNAEPARPLLIKA